MEPEDEDFYVKEFGGYKPVKQSVPVASIRPLITPIIGGETPEEQARRAAIETRAQTGERREDVRLGLAISAQQLAQQSQQLAQQGRQESL
jgi:hypothetical protein